MIESFKDLANVGTFLSAIAGAANVVVIAIIGFVAYRRFNLYEKKQYQSQTRTSLHPALEVKSFPATNADECVFGLTVTIENSGKVTALIDLSESNFVLEQFHKTFYDPSDFLEEKDGKKYFKPFSRLQTQFASLRVKLAGHEGVCKIEPGTTMSFANCAPALRGIYRVSVELALTEEGTTDFMDVTGVKLPPDERVVWTASVIRDTREETQVTHEEKI